MFASSLRAALAGLTVALLCGCSSAPAHEEFCERLAAANCTQQNGQSCDSTYSQTSSEFGNAGCEAELEAYFDCVASAIESNKDCTIANNNDKICEPQLNALSSCGRR